MAFKCWICSVLLVVLFGYTTVCGCATLVSQLCHAGVTTVSCRWHNCFMPVTQLFHAHDTTVSSRWYYCFMLVIRKHSLYGCLILKVVVVIWGWLLNTLSYIPLSNWEGCPFCFFLTKSVVTYENILLLLCYEGVADKTSATHLQRYLQHSMFLAIRCISAICCRWQIIREKVIYGWRLN